MVRTNSFTLTLPMIVSFKQEKSLNIIFEAGRYIYNAVLNEALKRMRAMKQDKQYSVARKMPKKIGNKYNPDRTKLFNKLAENHGFREYDFSKFAIKCRNACWINDHLSGHEMQNLIKRAFQNTKLFSLGKIGKPVFKRFGSLNSIQGQSSISTIIFRNNSIKYRKMIFPLIIDIKNNYQQEALQSRTKYCRILRRTVKGKTLWFAQLIQEGLPPKRRVSNPGVIGLDIGPSTIAMVSDNDASFEQFCPTIEDFSKEVKQIQRHISKLQTQNNSQHFNDNGTIKRGKNKKWYKSDRQRKLAHKKREIERKLAAERKRSHGELCNRILAQGTTIKTEKLNYVSFQKNYGKSVQVRAPGMFVELLRKKAFVSGGKIIEINTYTTALSQFDHTTGEFIKKPRNQRIHFFGDNKTEPVHRDLYSAFLAMYCDERVLDHRQVINAWPRVEPLLRQSMICINKPVNGFGFPIPALLSDKDNSGRMGCLPKKDTLSDAVDIEVKDDVASNCESHEEISIKDLQIFHSNLE